MVNQSIRRMAQAAKKRLNGASQEKTKSEKLTTYALYKNLYKSDHKTVILEERDEIFYTKLTKLLDENFDSPFILRLLVDEEVYNTLNSEDKMRYMLDLSDKYVRLRNRYIQERSLKKCS